jgi:hypothetical protein
MSDKHSQTPTGMYSWQTKAVCSSQTVNCTGWGRGGQSRLCTSAVTSCRTLGFANLESYVGEYSMCANSHPAQVPAL